MSVKDNTVLRSAPLYQIRSLVPTRFDHRPVYFEIIVLSTQWFILIADVAVFYW